MNSTMKLHSPLAELDPKTILKVANTSRMINVPPTLRRTRTTLAEPADVKSNWAIRQLSQVNEQTIELYLCKELYQVSLYYKKYPNKIAILGKWTLYKINGRSCFQYEQYCYCIICQRVIHFQVKLVCNLEGSLQAVVFTCTCCPCPCWWSNLSRNL